MVGGNERQEITGDSNSNVDIERSGCAVLRCIPLLHNAKNMQPLHGKGIH